MMASNKIRLCVVTTVLQRVYDLVNNLAQKYETHLIYIDYSVTKDYSPDTTNSFFSYPVKYPYKSGSLVEVGILGSITCVPLCVDMFMKIKRIVKKNIEN